MGYSEKRDEEDDRTPAWAWRIIAVLVIGTGIAFAAVFWWAWIDAVIDLVR